MQLPKVGVGVLIFNHNHHLLLVQRANSHGALTWSPVGGHLEFGESLEQCAIRETLEEINLLIPSPTFLALTNDFFIQENKHYISIFMQTHLPQNHPPISILEPHKILAANFFPLNNLPSPLFLPLQNLLSSTNAYGSPLLTPSPIN